MVSAAYLSGSDLSAFPSEDELLIGIGTFLVKGIQKEEGTGFVVIKLREYFHDFAEVNKMFKELFLPIVKLRDEMGNT